MYKAQRKKNIKKIRDTLKRGLSELKELENDVLDDDKFIKQYAQTVINTLMEADDELNWLGFEEARES